MQCPKCAADRFTRCGNADDLPCLEWPRPTTPPCAHTAASPGQARREDTKGVDEGG
jgi:hypothetical protein